MTDQELGNKDLLNGVKYKLNAAQKDFLKNPSGTNWHLLTAHMMIYQQQYQNPGMEPLGVAEAYRMYLESL